MVTKITQNGRLGILVDLKKGYPLKWEPDLPLRNVETPILPKGNTPESPSEKTQVPKKGGPKPI